MDMLREYLRVLISTEYCLTTTLIPPGSFTVMMDRVRHGKNVILAMINTDSCLQDLRKPLSAAIFGLTPPHRVCHTVPAHTTWPFFIYANRTSILCQGNTVAMNSSLQVMDAPLVHNKLSRGSNK